jgi:hypothetical protein
VEAGLLTCIKEKGQPHDFQLAGPVISPACAGRAKGHLYPE